MATATALPPELPPLEAFSACKLFGFTTGPKCVCVECDPIPNSSRFVFPAIIAPESSRRSTTVALYGLAKFVRIREPQVVGKSVVQMLSFTATSSPSSAEIAFPNEKDTSDSAILRNWS